MAAVKPVFYGPFARFADWYHGWRDGWAEIPPKPKTRNRRPDPVTTPHQEALIRRAQDAFAHERLRLEAGRSDLLKRLVHAQVRHERARTALDRAERELVDASVPPTEAELAQRRFGEERRDERLVR